MEAEIRGAALKLWVCPECLHTWDDKDVQKYHNGQPHCVGLHGNDESHGLRAAVYVVWLDAEALRQVGTKLAAIVARDIEQHGAKEALTEWNRLVYPDEDGGVQVMEDS